MENDKEKEALEKLMKLTKFIKATNMKIGPKKSDKGSDKWRTKDPKFASDKPKPEESEPPQDPTA